MDTHVTSTNLTRLLDRLSSKLLSTTGTSSPPSSLERTKISSNLEYARQLLLTLEKDSTTIRNPTHRQSLLSKLGEQKALIRRLNEKLQLLIQDATSDSDSDSGTESDADADAGADSDIVSDPSVPVPASTELPDATMTSGLRNRHQPTHQSMRAALLPAAEDDEVPPEKALDVHRAEQEALTSDMLSLAQQLKANSIRFGQELAKEKGILELASEGLDRNVLGIEGAGRKMNSLRRDENVGWLWGMLYPAIIAALMLVILMVLLLAPKLRWW